MKNIGIQETNGLLFDQVTGMPALDSVLQLTQGWLQEFAASPEFGDKMQLAFGDGVNVASLQDVWASGSLGTLPEIEVHPAAEINGANGAFAAETNTIYLAQELLSENVEQVARVFLEEYGHYVDSVLTPGDAPGDEGAIFADVVRGNELSSSDVAQLKAEDDTATVLLDGEAVEIEQFVAIAAEGDIEAGVGISYAIEYGWESIPLDSNLSISKLPEVFFTIGGGAAIPFGASSGLSFKGSLLLDLEDVPGWGAEFEVSTGVPIIDFDIFGSFSPTGAAKTLAENPNLTPIEAITGVFVGGVTPGVSADASILTVAGLPIQFLADVSYTWSLGPLDELVNELDQVADEVVDFAVNNPKTTLALLGASSPGLTPLALIGINTLTVLNLAENAVDAVTEAFNADIFSSSLEIATIAVSQGFDPIAIFNDIKQTLNSDTIDLINSQKDEFQNLLSFDNSQVVQDILNTSANNPDILQTAFDFGSVGQTIQELLANSDNSDANEPFLADLSNALNELPSNVLNGLMETAGNILPDSLPEITETLPDNTLDLISSALSSEEFFELLLPDFTKGVLDPSTKDTSPFINTPSFFTDDPESIENFISDFSSPSQDGIQKFADNLPDGFLEGLRDTFNSFLENPPQSLQDYISETFNKPFPDQPSKLPSSGNLPSLTDTLNQFQEEIAFVEFDVDTNNPLDLVGTLLGSTSGITVDPNSVNFQGESGSTSTYFLAEDDLGIKSGILLTSGDGTPPLENTSSSYTTSLGLPGDPDLDEVADNAFPGSGGTFDANTLEFSFNIDDPSVKAIKVSVVFGSDEFPEFSNTDFVDAAAVLVNGENVAFFDQNENQPLSVIDVNLEQGNFINNQASDVPDDFTGETKDLPIEYDGVSSPLTIIAPVKQGENTIKFGVADTGDTLFDSGLFVSNLQSFDLGSQFFDLPQGTLLLDLTGTVDDDDLTGTDVNEFIDAGGGDDTIDPGGGNDFISAGAGDDTIQGGQGNNQINGGSGIDTVIYSSLFAETPIQVNQDILTVGSGTDTLTNVEFIQFTDTTVSTTFLDALSLTVTDAEKSEGDDGKTSFTFTVTRPDNVTGDIEFKYEVTGSGDNPANADDFLGNVLPSGTVTFTGEETEKQITVDVTADTVVEPDEEFTLTLSSPDAGDDVTQPTATATITNDDEETEPNEITGTSGRDELTGTSENDSLTGGFGADILTGEAGSDQFVYESIRDAGDTITDFEIGSDQIVLTELLDSFGYDGSDALADGYVQVVEMGSNSAVQIDSDGPDGRGIFRPFILVENVAAADLSAASNFAF